MRYISLAVVVSVALVGCSSKPKEVKKPEPAVVKEVKKVEKKKPKKMNGTTVTESVSGGMVYAKNRELYETECEAGDGKGCSNLGALYELELGVPKNLYKAYTLNSRGCDLGDAWSCGKVGNFYRKGEGVREDAVASTRYYIKGCQLNDSISCNMTGQAYLHGRGVNKDYTEAERYYKKAITLGNTSAYNNLGYLYETEGEVEKAQVFYKKSCELKNKTGCYNLAMTYDEQKSFSYAYPYYVRSCNYGDSEACTKASMMIFKKKPGVPVDDKVSFSLDLKGCELDSKIACSDVAYDYKNGLGTVKDEMAAQKYYKKACKLGHKDSCKSVMGYQAAR
jgi:TPR repeat protein